MIILEYIINSKTYIFNKDHRIGNVFRYREIVIKNVYLNKIICI